MSDANKSAFFGGDFNTLIDPVLERELASGLTVDQVIAHEVGHDMPLYNLRGDVELPREPVFPMVYDMQRLDFRASAGAMFQKERPDLVEALEKREGRKLDILALGLVLKENRSAPRIGDDGCDYEVLPDETEELYGRLEASLKDYLGKPAE